MTLTCGILKLFSLITKPVYENLLHPHSWGDPSRPPLSHCSYRLLNPDYASSHKATSLTSLWRSGSPPVQHLLLSLDIQLALGKPTVLVEDILSLFAQHLIQVIFCDVGHSHHYSSSAFSLPFLSLEWESDWTVKLNQRRLGLFAVGDSPITGRFFARIAEDRDWAELPARGCASAQVPGEVCESVCACVSICGWVGEREDSQRPSLSFSSGAHFITSCSELKWVFCLESTCMSKRVHVCVYCVLYGEGQWCVSSCTVWLSTVSQLGRLVISRNN